MTFGKKLKHIRSEVLRMTQKELADSIGYTQAAIFAIESGKNKKASFELFRQLVIRHNVNPMFFIYEKSKEPPILKQDGIGTQPILQKLAKYEKLVDEMVKLKNGQ